MDILKDNPDIVHAILKRDNLNELLVALDRKPPYNVHKGECGFSVRWYSKLYLGGGGEALDFDDDEIKEAVRLIINKRIAANEKILCVDSELTARVHTAMLEKFNS